MLKEIIMRTSPCNCVGGGDRITTGFTLELRTSCDFTASIVVLHYLIIHTVISLCFTVLYTPFVSVFNFLLPCFI